MDNLTDVLLVQASWQKISTNISIFYKFEFSTPQWLPALQRSNTSKSFQVYKLKMIEESKIPNLLSDHDHEIKV